MAHDQSPLTLLNHRFTAFHCDAAEDLEAVGILALHTEQSIAQNDEDQFHWRVKLEVRFDADDKNKPSPYSGKVCIEGEFHVSENFKVIENEALIRVTASSMLYGACREMLANFTARSKHGILTLPSISFREKKEKISSEAAK